MKKILFCINSLGLGGQEKQLLDLVSNLKGEYDPSIFILKGNFDRLDYLRNLPNIYTKKIKYFRSLQLFKYINNIIKKNNYDIVYSFDLGSSIYALFPSKFNKIKMFFAQFNGSYISNKKLILFLKIFNPLYKNIICNSFAGANYLMSLGISQEKLRVINQGFNFKAMEEYPFDHLDLKKELKMDDDISLVGCVGKLNDDKDPITFLKAARVVNNRFPKALFCIIGDGEQKEKLGNFISENNMQSYFYLLPSRKEAPWLIKDFDIGVLSSRNEGLPNVLLEYMYWRKPIVTTDAGDSGRVVRDGENGFVVPKGDYEKMAEKILYFLQNTERAKEFGFRGRRILENEYSIQNQLEKYYKLFCQ